MRYKVEEKAGMEKAERSGVLKNEKDEKGGVEKTNG